MRLNIVNLVLLFLAVVVCSSEMTNAQAKKLAPGVLKVIPAIPNVRDSYSLPTVLPGLNSSSFEGNFVSGRDTLHGQTRNIVFFRDVWQYEFAFLGLRQLCYKQNNEFGHKNIWYMVYRVRNTGANLTYEEVKEDPRFTHLKAELKRDDSAYTRQEKFVPRFTLRGWAQTDKDKYEEVSYRDKISPRVLRKIQAVEDPNQRLLDTVEMMRTQLPVTKSANGAGAWGVAIWENVNPTIDYVSIDVHGITNAFRIAKEADGNIGFRRKTLQLNFWRPGDTRMEHNDRVRYGIPLVDDVPRQIRICQRYHLPGPLLRGYLVSERANQNVLVAEIDAETSLLNLKSDLIGQLDAGKSKGIPWSKAPEQLKKAFSDAAISIPEKTKVSQIIEGKKWSVKFDDTEYVISTEPQFWEPQFGGIRFIKSLDHVWVYR